MGDRAEQVVGADRDRRQRLRDLFQGHDRLVQTVGLELGSLLQLGVLDAERHLAPDRLQQLHVGVSQRPAGRDADQKVAGVLLAPQQGDDQRLVQSGQLPQQTQGGPGFVAQLGDPFGCRPRIESQAPAELAGGKPPEADQRFRRETDRGTDLEGLVFAAPRDQDGLVEGQGLEADREDGFGDRAVPGVPAQALAGLVEGGQAAHLLVERLGPLLQLRGHGVEGGAQLAQLVSAADPQTPAQVTARDRPRS